MKRLGEIITVLLVVLCFGTVISCAGTKDAVVKDSKKGNTSNKSANAQSLSEPLNADLNKSLNSSSNKDLSSSSNEDLNLETDELTQKADNTKKILPQSFLSEDCIAAQMLNVPNELQIENKEVALIEKADEKFSDVPEEVALVSNEDNSSKGSVLFTLKRADEIKNGESVPSEAAIVERPVMSVLQERLLGYKNDKKPAAKVEPSAVTFENYKSELAVLPVISVAPIKPEAMIQEKTYLAQVISLPKIAEEAAGDMTIETAVEENAVQSGTDALLPTSKPLQISLGTSVNPFGLPESFISPSSAPDTVENLNRTENRSADNAAVETKALPQIENRREILPPTTSVSEVVFAAKNQDEQNSALNEILSSNRIEMPTVKNENISVVYPQASEPEELEEAADFEMKPDFIYPEEKISGLENQETIIRMQGAGWRINEMNNYSMKLIERRNGSDGSTTFRIKNGNAGTEQIKFTRYNEAENRQETKVYSVDIRPVLVAGENNKKAAPKAKNAANSKANDDYRKTLADHLYADENYAQASVYYKKLIDENIADSELLYKAAHSMKEIGNADTAAEYYQRNLAEEGNPFYDDAIVEYIQLLKERKEFDKAINEVYERGLAKGVSEDCTQKLYRMLGDLFFNVKNYTEAVRTYKTVLSLYPAGSGEDKAMFYLAYALELQENPEFREAQRFYRELLEVYPESQYVNLSRSRIGFIDRHYIKVN